MLYSNSNGRRGRGRGRRDRFGQGRNNQGPSLEHNFHTSKTSQTRKECLAEGGAAMPNQADKIIPSSVDIVENLATRRQSAGRRRVSQLSQADNSPTMPLTPTMAIMTEWL